MSPKKNTPVPSNESSRLKALQEYQILDTLPEQSYDDIAKLAAHICCVDKGMVAFIDDHRKWHKARYNVAPIEVPREFSICSHTIMGSRPFIVPDTLLHPDTKHVGMVTQPPHVRFYAGIPLLTEDNLAIGTLCVIDTQPRELSEQQIESLIILAKQVMQLLKLHQSVMLLEFEKQQLYQSRIELDMLNQKLTLMSFTDELTSLNNRRSFDLAFKGAIQQSNNTPQPLSLLIIDIDHFKKFNDTHGHTFGDKVLIQVSKLIEKQARNTDFCARYGGEEFVILLPDTQLEDAQILAEEFRELIATQSFSEQKVHISIGIAQYCPGDDAATFFQQADAALLTAKNEGRNCVRYYRCD